MKSSLKTFDQTDKVRQLFGSVQRYSCYGLSPGTGMSLKLSQKNEIALHHVVVPCSSRSLSNDCSSLIFSSGTDGSVSVKCCLVLATCFSSIWPLVGFQPSYRTEVVPQRSSRFTRLWKFVRALPEG